MEHRSEGALSRIEGGLAGALVTGLSAVLVLIMLRALGGVTMPVSMMLLIIALAALLGGVIQKLVVGTAATAVESTLVADGKTTAYVPTFSHIEALEIRGDLAGAEQAWQEACREHPGNALVLVKAADFHLRLRNDPAAALQRYRQVRDLAVASPDLVRYASQKIIDLHLGPLADEGRALVELRRMIDRFPGTREAEDARAVLARLKHERAQGP
jgi:hypothetical protein